MTPPTSEQSSREREAFEREWQRIDAGFFSKDGPVKEAAWQIWQSARPTLSGQTAESGIAHHQESSIHAGCGAVDGVSTTGVKSVEAVEWSPAGYNKELAVDSTGKVRGEVCEHSIDSRWDARANDKRLGEYLNRDQAKAAVINALSTLSALPAQAVGESEAVRFLQEVVMGNYKPQQIAAAAQKVLERVIPLAAPMPQAEPTDEQIVEALREEMTLYDDGASVTDKVQLVRAVRRALEAWDGTVLPKSNDEMMQERMEDLREVLSIWRDECEKAGGFVNANAKGLLFTESALQRIGGALESLSAPQEASKPAKWWETEQGRADEMTRIENLAQQHGIALGKAMAQEASKVEPVAVIGRDWQLLYASPDTIAAIAERHCLKVGSRLYAHPSPQALSDEQCDVAIRRSGFWSMAASDPRALAMLRGLCREAIQAAIGGKA